MTTSATVCRAVLAVSPAKAGVQEEKSGSGSCEADGSRNMIDFGFSFPGYGSEYFMFSRSH